MKIRAISQSVHRWFDRTPVLITFVDHLLATVAEAVTDSRFILHLIGKVRRFYLVHFLKRYVQKQLYVRQGDCRQCGVCCNLLFTCPALTKQGRCLIYGLCRPQACKVFPIDQRDIDEVSHCSGRCGYNFAKIHARFMK